MRDLIKMTKLLIANQPCLELKNVYVAEGGFDPPTSGLWAQHASSAPRTTAPRATKSDLIDQKIDRESIYF